MDTTDVPNGVVVPKDDWPMPLTAPEIWAKGAEEILCLGERTSKVPVKVVETSI